MTPDVKKQDQTNDKSKNFVMQLKMDEPLKEEFQKNV